MKILYISATVPYDTVGHGGGQTFNYYIKQMARDTANDVTLVAYCLPNEYEKCDVEGYGIRFVPIIKNGGLKEKVGNALSINSKFNPFHKFGNIMTWYSSRLLINTLNKMKRDNYCPDVIVMEWTQITIQIDVIKKIFPHAIYVASEHDVAFLGLYRRAENESRKILKVIKRIKASNLKKRELAALEQCDVIFTHNFKDDELLKSEGITSEKRNILVPYYHKSKLSYSRKNNDILFYGNMKRKENYSAVFWFIDNVMPLLKDIPVRFVVIGGGPTEELKTRANDSIVVTGFVDAIDEWFKGSLCFVAPLLLGAGIKIKVIEALYTGIPVVTNDIGIEGIPATDGKDYIHCNTAEEFAAAIKSIFYGAMTNSIEGKETVNNQLSYESSFDNYYSVIYNKYSSKVS